MVLKRCLWPRPWDLWLSPSEKGPLKARLCRGHCDREISWALWVVSGASQVPLERQWGIQEIHEEGRLKVQLLQMAGKQPQAKELQPLLKRFFLSVALQPEELILNSWCPQPVSKPARCSGSHREDEAHPLKQKHRARDDSTDKTPAVQS